MDSHLDNKSLVEEYRARTLRAEVAVGNIVAGCPGNLKVMELASILGKTIVPHGSDFSATFGVGRLTEFLEGNDSFSLEGHCPKNVKVIRFTPKGRSLDLNPVQWPPKLRRDPVPPQHLIPAHHPALKPGQGLPPGVPDPRFVRTGERGQTSGPDPAGRSDADIHLDLQLECELTDYIGRSPDERVALDKDIEPHVAQIGLMPPNMGMRQWLSQRPAVFELDGQSVALTRQSIEYDRHLETQFVAFLQRLGRPAHLGKDIGSYCKKHNIEMRVPGRLASWFKSKHKVFKVDKEHITLKPNFLRKHNPSAEFGPPGFPAQDKAAPHPNPWHQGAKRSSEDQRILYLEEKILNWLAMKDKVTTTEMAEFAYATHEDLVPETWDANIFCQERNQLFKLSGYLHDQVELTDTGRSLTETTSRASHSPRARPAAARAAATRNHQQAARPEPHANHVNHRAPPANPRPDNVQESTELQQENAKLKERCNVLEGEVRALRQDMTALQRHLHMPVTLSALRFDDASPLPTNNKRTKTQICVLGGHNGSAWLEGVTTHRPHSQHWGRLPTLDSARSFAAADTWRDSVFVLGGGDGSQWFNTMLRCDTAQHSPSWLPVAPMKIERGSLAVATVGDYIYAIGGGKPNVQYDSVERYDPLQDRWTGQPKLNKPRFALSAASAHGALYAVGGFNGEFYMSSVEVYDPRVGRWQEQEYEMLYPRGSLAVTALGDSLYAIGGFDSKEALNVVEVMDTRTMKWRSLQPLSAERAYGEATVVDDQVYVVGGLQTNMTTYAPFIETYDSLLDQWEVPALPADIEPRAFAAVCSL